MRRRDDYEWALRLQADHLEPFYVRTRTPQGAAGPPAHGQLWLVVPEQGHVTAVEYTDETRKEKTRECPGLIREGQWRPTQLKPPGPQTWKIETWPLPPDGLHVEANGRPGMILGQPLGRHPDSAKLCLIDSGRAVYLGGTTQKLKDVYPFSVVVQYARPPVRSGRTAGRFEIADAWGIETPNDSSTHLYDCLGPLDSSQPVSGAEPDENPVQAATRWLAEALGVYSRPRRYSHPKFGPRFFQGEVVWIRYDPSQAAASDDSLVPSVVVSTNDYNAAANDAIIVARCIPANPSDRPDDPTVPILIPSLQDSMRSEQWMIDPALLRGIGSAQRGMLVRRYSPPHVLDRKTGPWTTLYRFLEALYG